MLFVRVGPMRSSLFATLGLTIVACATNDVPSKRSSSASVRPCVIEENVGDGFVPTDMSRTLAVGHGVAPDGSTQALVWGGGRPLPLGSLGGRESEARAVNERGDIVGTSMPKDAAAPHAVRWRKGVIQDLGTFGGDTSKALDVNERGEIVGYATTADGRKHAFAWRDGTMTDLGTLGGKESGATRINERGQIIGWSMTAPPVEMHAFLWDAGKMTDLGSASGAIDINERGDVIVQARAEAAFWRNGVTTAIAPFEETTITFLHALDEHGRAIGSTVTAGREVGFLWEDGAVTAIDVESAGWVTPIAINAHGQVVGFAAGSAGGRAFSWKGGELTFLAPDEEDSIAIAVDDRGRILGRSGTTAKLWQLGSCAASDN